MEQESQARREESVGAKRLKGPVQAMEMVDSEREGAKVARSWYTGIQDGRGSPCHESHCELQRGRHGSERAKWVKENQGKGYLKETVSL